MRLGRWGGGPARLIQGLEPGSPAEAGAGRDRQSDHDLTLGWVSDYESAVCKVKKEIPVYCLFELAVAFQIAFGSRLAHTHDAAVSS